MQILILPDWRSGNPYLDLLARSVNEADPSVEVRYGNFEPGHFQVFRSYIKAARPDVVHLHWITPWVGYVLCSRSSLKRSAKLLLCCLDMLLVRALGARVVWTIHNHLSHETTDPEMERRLRKFLCLAVNQVIVHSQSALEVVIEEYGVDLHTRAIVIPHGNYDGCYPIPTAQEKTPALPSSSDGTINILFFGTIRPYKGVERLLQSVQSARSARINLVIAGRPATDELAQTISDAAKRDRRICPIPRFIEVDEITTLFEWADVVALPFERTLTSGSAVLSLTLARPVLASESTRVLDIIDDTNAVFYTPENLESVLQALNKHELSTMRASARRSAESLKWDSIGHLLLRAYGLKER